jgi:type II secretory pathway pseudopilin PulG
VNPLSNQRGFSYVTLMCVVVLMGVTLTMVSQQWSVVAKRDREAELLFRGTRIKNAIETYAADYDVNKATRANQYPVSLEQLTQKPKRYLQKVYKDPMTGQDFEVIKVGSEVRGVRSRSKDAPMNKVQFKDAQTYSQIAFQADAPQAPVSPGIGSNPINPLNPLGAAVPPPSAVPPPVIPVP